MNILNFFTGIWSKVAGILALLVGALLMRGKYQSNKIDKLEKEASAIKKKSEIQEKDAKQKENAVSNEQEELLEIRKEVQKDEEITLDDFNKL